MALQPGSRAGPYEILSRVGAGGMGEVFRARDTRLGRTVAVKALPAQFAASAQLRLRLQREARAISSLTHPHICALYDLGEDDGVDYLVMEFLEGETLADRLSKGPLPFEEALRCAIEITEALEVAHREGVVHRDLKPGNVMLTKSGAKLVDFGLARTTSEQAPVTADAPTMQAHQPLTAEGTIVGTFQYMAPEQLEGQPADARTDLFAFGAVLYEMVTGRRAFEGKTKTSLIAAIVAGTPPPVSSLRAVAPPALDHVVQRCLDKDPDARWQSAHDVRLELEWIARQLGAPEAKRARAGSPIPWLVAALALLAAAAAWYFAWRSRSESKPLLHTHILAPRDKELNSLITTLTVAPNGRFVTLGIDGDPRLWLRDVGSLDARPLEGTQGAEFPFWSPDSRWIAFYADGKLKKIGLTGAPPVVLADTGHGGRSGSWNEDGTIVFAPRPSGSGLSRVSASGGDTKPLTTLNRARNETTHRWPVFLPDGNQFLYLAGVHEAAVGRDLNAVYLSSLDAPSKRKLLLRARSNVLISKGHLLYVNDGILLAHPFDATRGELRGEPFRIADRVEYDPEYFRATFDATQDGAIVYRSATHPPSGELAWVENGTVGPRFGPKLPYRQFGLSPDGRRIAAMVYEQSGLCDLWTIDLSEDRQTRLTATPNNGEWSAVWSRDGQRVLFARARGFGSRMGDTEEIFSIAADGASAEQRLFVGKDQLHIFDTSPDGRLVLLGRMTATARRRTADLMVMPMSGGTPQLFLEGVQEGSAAFSPDGRWISYLSDESGVSHVYAIRFPEKTSKMQISRQPSVFTYWLAEGIIAASSQDVHLVPVSLQNGRLQLGAARRILGFQRQMMTGDIVDSRRALVAISGDDPYGDTVTMLTDWQTP